MDPKGDLESLVVFVYSPRQPSWYRSILHDNDLTTRALYSRGPAAFSTERRTFK